jgi:BirA family biotin operon repressor/biotin-[acetyl-CoA-carboxylase] ligase
MKAAMHGALDITRICQSIAPRRVGRRILYRDTVESTNDVAWGESATSDGDGVVVLAEHQTGGRGRLGRSWHDARGASLLCSVLIVDAVGGLSPARAALAPCVAAADAIEQVLGLSVTLKWPNDLLIDGRKVGGVLVESRACPAGRAWVIGIGINCLQHRGHFDGELGAVATSLDLSGPRPVDRSALAGALLRELDGWLDGGALASTPTAATGEHELRRRWLSRASVLGSRITLCRGGVTYVGTVLDLDPTAALVVQLDRGGIRAFSVFDTNAVPEPPTAGTQAGGPTA